MIGLLSVLCAPVNRLVGEAWQRALAASQEQGPEFSLKREELVFDNLLIRAALQQAGSVTKAASLLGYRHHNSLIARISRDHKDLLSVRSTIKPRAKRKRIKAFPIPKEGHILGKLPAWFRVSGYSLATAVLYFEYVLIRQALIKGEWSLPQAAKLLKTSPETLAAILNGRQKKPFFLRASVEVLGSLRKLSEPRVAVPRFLPSELWSWFVTSNFNLEQAVRHFENLLVRDEQQNGALPLKSKARPRTVPRKRRSNTNEPVVTVVQQPPAVDPVLLSQVWLWFQASGFTLVEAIDHFEGQFIVKALLASQGEVTAAGRLLDLRHQSFLALMKANSRDFSMVRNEPKLRRKSIRSMKDMPCVPLGRYKTKGST